MEIYQAVIPTEDDKFFFLNDKKNNQVKWYDKLREFVGKDLWLWIVCVWSTSLCFSFLFSLSVDSYHVLRSRSRKRIKFYEFKSLGVHICVRWEFLFSLISRNLSECLGCRRLDRTCLTNPQTFLSQQLTIQKFSIFHVPFQEEAKFIHATCRFRSTWFHVKFQSKLTMKITENEWTWLKSIFFETTFPRLFVSEWIMFWWWFSWFVNLLGDDFYLFMFERNKLKKFS